MRLTEEDVARSVGCMEKHTIRRMVNSKSSSLSSKRWRKASTPGSEMWLQVPPKKRRSCHSSFGYASSQAWRVWMEFTSPQAHRRHIRSCCRHRETRISQGRGPCAGGGVYRLSKQRIKRPEIVEGRGLPLCSVRGIRVAIEGNPRIGPGLEFAVKIWNVSQDVYDFRRLIDGTAWKGKPCALMERRA